MRENSSISNSKTIFKILIFLICCGFIFSYFGKKYEQAADKNVINYFTKARFDDFYAIPENTLDLVFVGSSHSYCSFDPENFDDELNILSHQMGTPLQHPDTTYYELLEIYKTQNPKVVVMEVYFDMLNDDFEMKQASSFFEVLNDTDMKERYIKEAFPLNEKIKYKLAPVRFQQDYFAYEGNEISKKLEENLGVYKKAVETNGIEEYRSKGYVYCDTVMVDSEYDETNQFKGFDGKTWEFSKVQKEYLEKIIKLCEEKGSELIFVTAPIANVSVDYLSHYEFVHNEISAFAEEYGIPYYDYILIAKEEKMFENENFRDDAHLNDSGVKILDEHFIEILREYF